MPVPWRWPYTSGVFTPDFTLQSPGSSYSFHHPGPTSWEQRQASLRVGPGLRNLKLLRWCHQIALLQVLDHPRRGGEGGRLTKQPWSTPSLGRNSLASIKWAQPPTEHRQPSAGGFPIRTKESRTWRDSSQVQGGQWCNKNQEPLALCPSSTTHPGNHDFSAPPFLI